MFTTTVSEIKAFWNDPHRWYLAYVHPRRVPRFKGTALVAGGEWHVFMENVLNGIDRGEALLRLERAMAVHIDEALGNGFMQRAVDLEKELERFVVAGELWQDWLPVETLAVERPLELTLQANMLIPEGASYTASIRLLGRPDRVVRLRDTGRIAHYQHRTLGGSKPVAPYLETFHRNAHEGLYWQMLKNEYGEEPYGVVLNLLRKLSVGTIRKTPDVAMQQHPIAITPEQSIKTQMNIVKTCNAMIRARNEPELYAYDVPEMDLGRFGNSLDPYFEYLSTGDVDLLMDDTKFVNTEDRYADAEVEA